MNKKIILSLGLAVLLALPLVASQKNCDMQKGDSKKSECSNMKENEHKNPLIKEMMSLNLSDKQRDEIKAIMREKMQSMPKISTAFSDTAFDKELFIKLSKEKEEGKIEKKAEIIASIYAVLTPVQKAELKKIVDEQMRMRKR